MKTNTFVLVCGLAAAGLIAGLLSVTVSRPANATPAFAGSTGKPCGFCHQNPAGGGALKPAGQQFKDKGNKL
jgi:hypothetical protein